MKKLLLLCPAVLGALFFASPAPAQEPEGNNKMAGKVLVAYYSWSGNTKQIAQAIHEKVGGDIFEIQTAKPYPEEYRATVDLAKEEIRKGVRPELKTKVGDMSVYDTVFIGSPNWWGTIAPAVSTFLESYDLSGKTVIPFVTHGGGGIQNTVKDLTAQCKGCSVGSSWVGYGNSASGLSEWLERGGY